VRDACLLGALKAEVDEYTAEQADHRDDAGHALAVRNGVAEPRTDDCRLRVSLTGSSRSNTQVRLRCHRR